MKAFDLDAAKRGEPIVTRDGRKAVYVGCTDAPINYPLACLVEGANGVSSFTAGGAYTQASQSKADLFMAPKKRTLYVNVYPNGPANDAAGYVYRTEAQADQKAARERIGGKAWPLEIEE
jgi:hypothetical protein